MDKIDRIITEVIDEIEHGLVKSIKYRIKVHTNISSSFEEITPVLNIKDKELLYSKIKEYVLPYLKTSEYALTDCKEDFIKRIIASLFVNMSLDDFNNPTSYVQRIINFKNERLLQNRITNPIPMLENSRLYIQINNYGIETPYSFQTVLINTDSYLLPTISYGISDNICYIYAIQDYNKHEKTPYHQKIKRKLYKLNDKVINSETQEYKDYKGGVSDYYPENISDVSPSAVFALTIFLNEIEKNGIYKVEVVPYLPVRYENKIKFIAKKVLEKSRKENLNKEETRKLYMESITSQMYVQDNMTQKLIRTFYRVAYHFENVNITSLPMELDDRLHISLSKFEYTDNELLNEVITISNKKTRQNK